MSEENVVTYELDGETALIGLNRPEKRNALNPPLRAQLLEAVLRAGEGGPSSSSPWRELSRRPHLAGGGELEGEKGSPRPVPLNGIG